MRRELKAAGRVENQQCGSAGMFGPACFRQTSNCMYTVINIVMNLGAKRCAGWVFMAKLSHAETGNLTLDNRQRHKKKTGFSTVFSHHAIIPVENQKMLGPTSGCLCLNTAIRCNILSLFCNTCGNLFIFWLHWHCYFIHFNIGVPSNQNFPTVL